MQNINTPVAKCNRDDNGVDLLLSLFSCDSVLNYTFLSKFRLHMSPVQDTQYFIGLMSGTSTDGVDGVIAAFSPEQPPRLLARASLPMPAMLRQHFLELNAPGHNELEKSCLAANELAHLYAQVCTQLLKQAQLAPKQVTAIGAHGQTVRHRPELGYTIQLNAPALLSELTQIAVVADFRSKDIAAGGQGAPLVPAFHQALFGVHRPVTVLNLGGMANISILHPAKEISGFDTGPANVLMDIWCQHHTGKEYDQNGQWGASGTVNEVLLNYLLAAEPWFALPPPKSTGRDLFNLDWLNTRLAGFKQSICAPDVQASLRALTAQTIASAIHAYAPGTQEIIACGGGALNGPLLQELALRAHLPVSRCEDYGVPGQSMEALAFAWLAWAHCNRVPAGTPSVSGARRKTVLGCYYPA